MGELRLNMNPPGLWHSLSAAGEAGVVWPIIGFSNVSGCSVVLKQTQNVVLSWLGHLLSSSHFSPEMCWLCRTLSGPSESRGWKDMLSFSGHNILIASE